MPLNVTRWSVPHGLPTNKCTVGMDIALNASALAVLRPGSLLVYAWTFEGVPEVQTITSVQDVIRAALSDAEVVAADLLAIEAGAFRSASRQFTLGAAWGSVVAAVAGPPIISVPPTSLKKAIAANGRAAKGDMLTSITAHLPTAPYAHDDNAVDAVSLAYLGQVVLTPSLSSVRATREVARSLELHTTTPLPVRIREHGTIG